MVIALQPCQWRENPKTSGSVERPSGSAAHPDSGRNSTILRILELQARLETSDADKKVLVSKRSGNLLKTSLVWTVFGRRLSQAFGELLIAVKEERRPYLGSELAQTLEALSRKVMGYKRWILLIGFMTALPGFVSVALLWQQNSTVARTKENTLNDLSNNERVVLLRTIYDTYDKSEAGMLTTPIASAPNRRNAVFRLIERDAETLRHQEKADLLGLNHMVDLSIAPLNDVDFSPIDAEQAFHFRNVGFVNSNFEDASFAECRFTNVWFSSAYLWKTDFRNAQFMGVAFDQASILGADFTGATFEQCDFSGAFYDSKTRWPDGFNPEAAGAQLLTSDS